jgi:hypothetical protein
MMKSTEEENEGKENEVKERKEEKLYVQRKYNLLFLST